MNRRITGVVAGLFAVVALSSCAVSAGPPRQTAQTTQPSVTITTTLAPDVAPSGVMYGNACSISELVLLLNAFGAAQHLFGHPATNQEAQLFGQTFYGCLNFTT